MLSSQNTEFCDTASGSSLAIMFYKFSRKSHLSCELRRKTREYNVSMEFMGTIIVCRERWANIHDNSTGGLIFKIIITHKKKPHPIIITQQHAIIPIGNRENYLSIRYCRSGGHSTGTVYQKHESLFYSSIISDIISYSLIKCVVLSSWK
jgi:hypothetical protein